MFAWWCLSLWPCLIRFFVMTVGVLWVFYLQWHQLPRWVFLLYLPLLVILRLSTQFLWKMSRRKFKATLTVTVELSKHPMVDKLKQAGVKNALFLWLPPSYPPWSQPPRVGENDIMDYTLLFDLSFLYWLYPYHRTKWQVPIEIKKIEPINETSTLQHKLRDYEQWL